MKLLSLPEIPGARLGVRLDRLEIANSVQWLVTIRGRNRAVDRELFDAEAVARNWAIAQADVRHLPFLDQCEPEAA